jgi:Universal stress protein family
MLEIKLILCPVDFSEVSTRAYHHAQSLADHYRAKLVALHIVELSDIHSRIMSPLPETMGNSAVRLARVARNNSDNLCRTMLAKGFSRNSSSMREQHPTAFCLWRKRKKRTSSSWERAAGVDMTVWCWARSPAV